MTRFRSASSGAVPEHQDVALLVQDVVDADVLRWKRTYAWLMLFASSSVARTTTVTELPGRRARKAPPVAVEATKSSLPPMRTPLWCPRQAFVFTRSYRGHRAGCRRRPGAPRAPSRMTDRLRHGSAVYGRGRADGRRATAGIVWPGGGRRRPARRYARLVVRVGATSSRVRHSRSTPGSSTRRSPARSPARRTRAGARYVDVVYADQHVRRSHISSRPRTSSAGRRRGSSSGSRARRGARRADRDHRRRRAGALRRSRRRARRAGPPARARRGAPRI